MVDLCSLLLLPMTPYKVVLYKRLMNSGVLTFGAGMEEKQLVFQFVKRNMVSVLILQSCAIFFMFTYPDNVN